MVMVNSKDDENGRCGDDLECEVVRRFPAANDSSAKQSSMVEARMGSDEITRCTMEACRCM